jgi:L-asparaginase II
MPGGGSFVDVTRGSLVESRHRVAVAVADGAGRVRAVSGEVGRPVYARSAVKPIQAIPLVEDGVADRLGITEAELALACASHSGEPRHVELARSLLARAGADEGMLACGAHRPFHAPAAEDLRRRGKAAGRIHNNCSGKHAGMLALARVKGWSLAGYHEADHPVQRRMLDEMARWSDVPGGDIVTAPDGCGVLTFAVPLRALAAAFGRIAGAAGRGRGGARVVIAAMTAHPEVVGGTDRVCTEVMKATGGRVFLKVGAEGVYAAGAPQAEVGVALKVEDGAGRAAESAVVAVLHKLGLLTDDELLAIDRFARPPVLNTRGEQVGVVRPRIELEAVNG